MVIPSIEPATKAHAKHIADNVRPADALELWEYAFRKPYDVMLSGMADAEAFTGLADGVPVCMWGVVPICILTDTGAPWMVGTTELESNAVAFLRRCRPQVKEMLAKHRNLVNYVDERNVMAVNWIKWLGFKVEAAAPAGLLNKPFHRFSMENEDV